ncbi:FxLYD domain-containing protein [Meiothermus granaticius]|uniref:CARDB domain-containing protein n=1 Tax=Meiothermus granaticius NBRC 107808 TaxID=1227551 RepID=A0A399FDD1_9DEIN|nr:FxLYD domain-containing protein [Meiothermus granaticius]RIH92811.1 hypothetical protein Mgrana_01216 [Meiothermus granaticius NBRC 107808]GEM85525.1 hypothetical protein MGR01S_01500 [Meiothermus granaticius NBRC 107808]
MRILHVCTGVMLMATSGLALQSPYHLKVLSWSCQLSPRDAWVRGTVRNIGDRPLQDVRASARVLGRGLRVATNSAPIRARILRPGETASFSVRVPTYFDSKRRCELGFRNPALIQIASLIPDPR